MAGPDAGALEYSIDGGPAHTLETYHRFSKGLHYPRTVMFRTDLDPGPHQLRLRMSGKSSSGGHAARILEFVENATD